MTTKILDIPLGNITPSPLNPRKTFRPERIKEVADSIKLHGILENLIVRKVKKGYELVVGETRWRSAKVAGLRAVPCVVADYDDSQVLAIMLTENMQRSDLSVIEEAEGIRQMADLSKKSVKEIAAELGKSGSFISQRLRIAALAPITKKAVLEDKIPISLALYIGRIAEEDGQIEATKTVTSQRAQNWSLDDATDYIRSTFLLDLASAPFDPSDATLPRDWDDGKPGSCDKCPFNSACDKELFADLGKDARCTKPSCFEGKKNEVWKRAQGAANDAGHEIIPATKSKEMFYNSGELNYEAERDFVDLSKPQGLNGKRIDLAKEMAGKVSISIAQRPDGSVAMLAPKGEVTKALKAAGLVEAPKKSDLQREQDLRSKAQKQEHVLLARAITGSCAHADLANLVVGACKQHTTGLRATFVKNALDGQKGCDVDELVQALAVTNDNALLLVLANLEFYGIGKATEELAKILKIDRAAIKKQAILDVSPKEKKNLGTKPVKGKAAINASADSHSAPTIAGSNPAVSTPRKRRSQPEVHARRKRA